MPTNRLIDAAVKRAIAEARYAQQFAAWLAVMRAQGIVT